MFSRFSRRRINRRANAKKSLVLTSVAALAATPVLAIGAGKAFELVQDGGSGPVDAAVKTVSLAKSASVLVEDAAIATQGLIDDVHPNRGVVKEITSDTEFSQFALTWHGSADVASFVRAQRADGTWSDWFEADPEYPAEGNGNGLNGTELVFIEPTKRVQVSTHGFNIFGPGSGVNFEDIEGADKLDLSKLDINLGDVSHDGSPAAPKVDETTKKAADKVGEAAKSVGEAIENFYQQTPDASPEDAQDDPTAPKETGTVVPSAGDSPSAPVKWADITPVADELPLDQVDAVLIDGQAAASAIDPIVDAKNITGMPKVITRAGWGANESQRCQGPDYDDKLVGATVHHTAGSNNYTQAQAAGIVRGIYQYHAQTLGWCDIGYNALVDKFGNIYEGRYGGLDKNVQGAHAGGFNTGTFGISMMGNYTSVAPSQAMINAVGNMIGWRLKVAGIKPKGSMQMTSGGTNYSKYAYGTQVTLPHIFAHRDVGNTTCPGDAGYAQMDSIRNIAEKKFNNLASGNTENESPTGESNLQVPKDKLEEIAKGVGIDTDTVSNKSSEKNEKKSSSASSSSSSSTTTTASKSSATTTSSAEPTSKSVNPSASSSVTTSSGASAADNEPSASGSASEGTSGSSEPTTSADYALDYISGARSMLASALGMLGAPGLGSTADAVLEAVGRSVENGPSIADLPILVEKIISINEQNDLAAEWRKVSEELGSVLGYAMSGIQNGATVSNGDGKADPLRYVKFSNGVITDSETTGTHAIWGKIADEWAKQGFEIGKLGAPTSTQTVDGNTERAEFQNGTITLDRSTGETKTELK